MDSPNGWQRDTAHMMLTWLNKEEQKKAVSNLHQVLNSDFPAARAQALSALNDLDSLWPKAMQIGLEDKHPGVRRNALRVGGDLLNQSAELGQMVVSLLDDEDAHVRYALGGTIHAPDSWASSSLKMSSYMRAAALSLSLEVLITVLTTPVTVALGTELMGMLGDDAKVPGADQSQLPPMESLMRTETDCGDPF